MKNTDIFHITIQYGSEHQKENLRKNFDQILKSFEWFVAEQHQKNTIKVRTYFDIPQEMSV